MIAAVILAAGLSTRMAGNKLLAMIDGKPVVRHVAEAALASLATPVIVVTGNAAEDVAGALQGLDVRICKNAAYANGLSESLKCGVSNVPGDRAGVVVLLGDMPFVSAVTIDKLIKGFAPDSGCEIGVPVRAGRWGNPVLWGRRFFGELLALSGDKGAKPLMDLHGDVLYDVEVGDDGVLIDIDTPEDLNRHRP